MAAMSLTRDARPVSDSVIINALRKRGYKATSQRIAICRLVLSSREHPTAQRIYREMRRLHPTVSVATVYKTLRVLRELRLVQELPLPRGETRFDSNLSPHVNVVCLQCGSVSDVNDQTIRGVVGRAASRIKFTVTAQRFDVYGICQKCVGRRSGSFT
jgi:Fur family peroxide stress response transcriptional regulator